MYYSPSPIRLVAASLRGPRKVELRNGPSGAKRAGKNFFFRLLRVQLDDELLIDRHLDLLTLGQ